MQLNAAAIVHQLWSSSRSSLLMLSFATLSWMILRWIPTNKLVGAWSLFTILCVPHNILYIAVILIFLSLFQVSSFLLRIVFCASL